MLSNNNNLMMTLMEFSVILREFQNLNETKYPQIMSRSTNIMLDELNYLPSLCSLDRFCFQRY